MTVLRSREVGSVTQSRHWHKSKESGGENEPSTPMKEVEQTNKSSYDETTPSSDKLVQSSDTPGVLGSTDSGSISNQGLRSVRQSLKSSSYSLVENVKFRRKRKVVNIENGGSESVQEGDAGNGCLKLRSGKKLLKPGAINIASDKELSAHQDGKATERYSESGVTTEAEGGSIGNKNDSEKAWRRFNKEDKKKGVLMDGDDYVESGFEKQIKIGGCEKLEKGCKTTVGEEMEMDINGTIERDTKRLSIEEKGKGKVVEVELSSHLIDMVNLNVQPKDGSVTDGAIVDIVSLEQRTSEREDTDTKRGPKERFKTVARENASRFAYFSVQEEGEDPLEDDAELELLETEANGDVEDWPGPFSTAMKIIKDRAVKMPTQEKHLTSEESHSVPLTWIPKERQRARLLKVAPSLQELCMAIMAENVDAITSLESVPDVLRHKLTQLLCDRRKMNNHFLNLLGRGSPSEIRVRDCSWLNEDQLTETFVKTDTSKLTVLQLDQCGRCLPDYVIFTSLAQSPGMLSALTNISLKGACRLSDAGLNALVGSASALRSINLGCCSLLTSDGIINLADKLGAVLKELYIDECFGIDAMRILPALLKLEQLEVLSMSRFESINDSFIRRFVAVGGEKMKELVLADCTKLTDKSLKAIAERCPGLFAIDVTNLSKLTDASIGHLANGCQAIQTLKFCRNAFSDEAVAAYVEARGESLKELSLNHVDKVGNCTAISLAKHGRRLDSLDLSWCRKMSNEAVGLIVDSCLSLRMLKLFGCTQITNVFTDGHSNEEVKIIGLKGSEILKNMEMPHLLPLRYSST